MKKPLDLTILMYLAVAMAFVTLIPSIGINSWVANTSSNVLLFLEAMRSVIYLYSLFIMIWFVISKKAVVDQNKKGLTVTHLKLNPVASITHFTLLVFLFLVPNFPSQKQLVFLLIANAVLRLLFKAVAKKALSKAHDMIEKENA